MIRIYERSLCQSYASAYRQGILLAKTDDEAEALSIVESLTDDSYQCFALYWEATEGNAKRALLQLLAMARMRPDGVWDGD